MDFRFSITERSSGNLLVKNKNNHEDKEFLLNAEDAAEALMVKTTRKTGVLPPVVRYISSTGRFILLERPPQIMTFNYYGKMKNDIDGAKLQEFDLPLPWTQYAIGLDHLNRPYFTYVFGTPRSILSNRDVLNILPVTNCETNGKFCTPYPEWDPSETEPWSIADGINTAYATIWNSNFNTDIISNILSSYRARRPSEIFAGKGDRGPLPKDKAPKPSNLFKRWEEFTLADVSEWKDWIPAKWPDADPVRVENVIYMLRNAERDFNGVYLYNTLRQRTMM